jgi:hypothetical protein
MRIYARFSYFTSAVTALVALVLHFKAITGVWAGIPYREDILVYPNASIDRWSVGFATVAIACFVYGLLFSWIAVDEDKTMDEIKRFAELKVLNEYK